MHPQMIRNVHVLDEIPDPVPSDDFNGVTSKIYLLAFSSDEIYNGHLFHFSVNEHYIDSSVWIFLMH